jgi:hypothetical protein
MKAFFFIALFLTVSCVTKDEAIAVVDFDLLKESIPNVIQLVPAIQNTIELFGNEEYDDAFELLAYTIEKGYPVIGNLFNAFEYHPENFAVNLQGWNWRDFVNSGGIKLPCFNICYNYGNNMKCTCQ